MKLKYKYIALDFDGTISELALHPAFGPPKPHAIEVIQMIKELGGSISIWTCRTDDDEIRVKEYLKEYNIPYDHFNEPFPEISHIFGGSGRKIFADIYIDDKSIHCKEIDWLEIKSLLLEGSE